MITAIELVQRAIEEGYDILKPQLKRMLMAQSKPRKTKKSGNGSKRKGTKKLKALSKR